MHVNKTTREKHTESIQYKVTKKPYTRTGVKLYIFKRERQSHNANCANVDSPWSLGCTGVFDPRAPPANSIARLAMTSFVFMFVWVPDPVCHTNRGK